MALDLLRTRRARNTLTLALVVLGPVLALATGLALSEDGILMVQVLRPLLLLDFVYVLVILGLVAQRVAATFSARRRKSAGSRLHMRLMGVFALIALIPTILVAVFATLTLNFGLEGWFSDRVRNVVGNSLAAAQAYEEEHRSNLIEDAELLAGFLNDQKERFPLISPAQFRELLNRGQLQMQRELPEAYVIDGDGQLRARGERSYLFDYEEPTPEEIERALNGETVIIEDQPNFEFRALVALPAFVDHLLYVTRDVDGEILQLLDETQETVKLYQQLETERGRLLFEFALIYLGFALIVILAAIWLGLWFAERLSHPVGKLAEAAQRVGAGDLDVQVAEDDGDDEISMLGRVFNRMTHQVKGQRDALVEANAETERRRRLFDSILTSVTAGVIGLDAAGRIEMINAAATEILDIQAVRPGEMTLEEAVPEFSDLFHKLDREIGAVTQSEVRMMRTGGEATLLVRMSTRAGADGQVEGFVVTFDDVSDLVSAQRMAAWGDVARRIAHEIKNPLTPIQLSAERLRRKFGPKVGDERETLEQYSDVIIRQTGDLRRIVDEFSKFARMPAAERRRADLMGVIRDATLLQDSARSDIKFVLDAPDAPIEASIDETMISQALTNLLKNAGEAIDEYIEKEHPEDYAPEIRVIVTDTYGALLIQIQDNGIGLPAQHRSRLFEPYVTHKSKGTGLGLSIVRKIIEEHAGRLELMDAPPFHEEDAHFGAEARILLPIGQDGVVPQQHQDVA
ncbi:sensor histidine kinase NtrY-like [Halovulum sp. GXIMD14794]